MQICLSVMIFPCTEDTKKGYGLWTEQYTHVHTNDTNVQAKVLW